MIRLSVPVYGLLEKALPQKWNEALKRYSNAAQSITTISDWRKILRINAVNMVAYTVVLISIVILSIELIQPFFSTGKWGTVITLVVTLLVMLPFLWALAFRRSDENAYANIWQQRRYRGPLVMLQLIRIGLAVFIIGFLTDRLFSSKAALAVSLIMIGVLLFFSRKIQTFYNHIETRFLKNLNEKELQEQQKEMAELAPWDAHIAHFEVASDAALVGKSLESLSLRENFGVNIAMIERGSKVIIGPSRDYAIYPGDVLSVIGTDEQLQAFRTYMEPQKTSRNILAQKQEVGLKQFIIRESSPLLGKTIRESGIRERTRGIIVGIERDGIRTLNPDSSVDFHSGDVVWIVGSLRRIRQYI
jgi:CPA2 family monovalent cation:H+ antiporter-2